MPFEIVLFVEDNLSADFNNSLRWKSECCGRMLERVEMFKRLLFVLLTVFAANAASAQDELVGLWTYESCDDETSLEYQGFNLAFYHNDQHFEVIWLEVLPTINSGWYLVRTDATDVAPALAQENEGVFSLAWYNVEVSASDAKTLHESLLDGTLNPEDQPNLFDVDQAVPCDGLPPQVSFVYGEQLAVLMQLDAALWSCKSSPSTCARKLFEVGDVSGDLELSVAELSRIFRTSLAVGSASSGSASNEQMVWLSAAGIALARLASSAILYSFDYDRSGGVSFDELLSERWPANWSAADLERSSFSEILDDLNEMARAAAVGASSILR